MNPFLKDHPPHIPHTALCDDDSLKLALTTRGLKLISELEFLEIGSWWCEGREGISQRAEKQVD